MKIAVDIEKPLKAKSKEDLIKVAVEIYSALVVENKYILRPRELEFFIGCVIAYHRGIDIVSKDFMKFMVEEYKFSKDERQVYNFRSTLIKKRWLKSNGDTLKIPPLFTNDVDKLIVNVIVES